MADCRLCKHLKLHTKTEHGYTCIAYKDFPDMVIYVPGKSELGCDYYEPIGGVDNGTTDYISREALLKMIGTMPSSPITDREERLIRAFISTVKNFPAADVREVVRGKWNRTDAYPHRLYCSVCFKTYLKNDELLERWDFPLNFCPNCGANMREESI